MRRPRQYRRPWLWLPILIGSATAQGAVLLGYSITRPEALPVLTIELAGEGNGTVLITRVGESVPLMRCSNDVCSVEVPRGAALQLVAIADSGATFGGYYPEPMRPPLALQPLLGDPLAKCIKPDSADVGDVGAADVVDIRDPNNCQVTIIANARILVDFGEVPREVDVALLDPQPEMAKWNPVAALPPPKNQSKNSPKIWSRHRRSKLRCCHRPSPIWCRRRRKSHPNRWRRCRPT